jgi:hypothetical protein
MKELINRLKETHKGRFPKASREVLYTVAAAVAPNGTDDTAVSFSSLEYLIGLNRHVAAAGVAARGRVMDGKSAAPTIKIRSDKIPKQVEDHARMWWHENTRESENTADQICDVRLKRGRGVGLKQPKDNSHRVHYREKSYLKMYGDFRKSWTAHNTKLYKLHVDAKRAHDDAVDDAHTTVEVSALGPPPAYVEWAVGCDPSPSRVGRLAPRVRRSAPRNSTGTIMLKDNLIADLGTKIIILQNLAQ